MRVDKVSIAAHNEKGAKAQQQRFFFSSGYSIPNASAIVDKLSLSRSPVGLWEQGVRASEDSAKVVKTRIWKKRLRMLIVHALTGSVMPSPFIYLGIFQKTP